MLCAPAFIRAGSAVQDVLRSDRCASSMQSCAESLTGGRIFNKTLATPHRCAAAGANPNACGRFLLGGEPAAGKAIEKVTSCTSTHPVRVRWCGCCFGAFESGLPRRAGAILGRVDHRIRRLEHWWAVRAQRVRLCVSLLAQVTSLFHWAKDNMICTNLWCVRIHNAN